MTESSYRAQKTKWEWLILLVGKRYFKVDSYKDLFLKTGMILVVL